MVVETDYMVWLMEELKELDIGDQILECIRSMGCKGDYEEKCIITPSLKNEESEMVGLNEAECGSSMQGDQVSTQADDLHYVEVDECIRKMNCDSNCLGICDVATTTIMHSTASGNSMQAEQVSTLAEDMQCVHCPGLCRGACSSENIAMNMYNEIGEADSHLTKPDTVHSISETGCVYIVQPVHTGEGYCTGDIISGPIEGPVCMNTPGWKSSQGANTSGVCGSEGAKFSVQKGRQLDWSKWTGAIHISSEGPSINMETGMK